MNGNTPKNNFNYSKLSESKKKDLILKLEKGYDCDLSKLKNFEFYVNNSDKVFIFNGDDTNVDLSRVNLKGIYFGTFTNDGLLRLSIEGCNFIEPKINFVILKKQAIPKFLSAKEIDDSMLENIKRNNEYPFLIVQYDKTNIGVISGKQEPYYNYVPKARKLEEEKIF